MIRKYLIIILALSICSCSIWPIGENYKKPKTAMPHKWRALKAEEQLSFAEIEINWWQNFEDPILNKVVALALENNYDFLIAQSKVLESRANISAKNSDLLPKVNAKASGTKMNNFFNPINPNKHPIVNFFSAGFDASWELDFLGGNYRAKQAAKALWEASSEERNYNYISLIAEVVRNYAALRAAQNQLFLQKEINKSYEEIVALNDEKKSVGLLSDIDFGLIKIEMLNNKSNLAESEATATIALYNLELLLGKKPGEMALFLGEFAPVPIIRKDIIISAPADLLHNRPDIKQAERVLEAETALKGYALAQVFPKISLTGFFGFNNTKTTNLFTPQSRVFSAGSNISMPVVNFGGLSAAIKTADEKKKQALLNYEAKVNQALIDAESSMINFIKEDEKLFLSLQSYDIYNMISKLNYERSKQGVISHLDYLKSHIELLKSKQELNQSKLAFCQKTVALYKSLGGAWINNETKNEKTSNNRN